MEETQIEKLKKRNWSMLLYPEDATHVAAMEKLAAGGYKYVAILHDSDVWAEGESDSHTAGEPKKVHWHVVLKFPQARYRSAVAKELGIAENYMEPCTNFDAACLYLVHANHENKHQYDPSALFGTLVSCVNKLLADDDEGTRVLEIVKTIDACPGKASYRDLLVCACKNGYYGEFRRLGMGVSALIKEHNEEYFGLSQSNAGVMVSKEAFEEYLRWTSSKMDDVQPL